MWDGPAWIEVRNRLVVEHLDWAHGFARRIARRLPTWFEPADLMGAVEMALIKLSDDYRSYQNVPFRAFAAQRLQGACYDAIRRREYKERGHAELGDTHVDPSPSPERLAELAEMEGVWLAVEKLPVRHAAVIRMIFREGLDGNEAGARIGVKRSRISRLRAEALEMLREAMAK